MKDDMILVAGDSRTGQTWLCMVLSYILNARFIEPYCLLRGILFDGRQEILDLTSGELPGREKNNIRFIVKTHEQPDPFYSLTQALIVIVRDPRDSISSRYLRRKVVIDLKTDVEDQGRKLALQPKQKIRLGFKNSLYNLIYANKIIAVFLSALKWKKFYDEWCSLSFATVIKFEELKENPNKTMTLILENLSISVDNNLIEQAFEEFSIQKRNKSQENEDSNKNLTFRKGIVGDHKEHLNLIQLMIIRLICGKTAKKFGYDL